MFFRILVYLTCECFCWTLGCKGYLSNKCRGSIITTHWTREYPSPQPRNSRGFTRPEPVSSQPGFCIYPPLALFFLYFFYDFSTSVTLIFSLHWYIHPANASRALLSGGALQSLPVPLLQFLKRKKDRWFFFSSDQKKKKKFLLVVCVSHPPPLREASFSSQMPLLRFGTQCSPLWVFFHKIFVALARWFIPLIVLPLSRGSPALLHSVCIGSLTGPGKAELRSRAL